MPLEAVTQFIAVASMHDQVEMRLNIFRIFAMLDAEVDTADKGNGKRIQWRLEQAFKRLSIKFVKRVVAIIVLTRNDSDEVD